MRIITLCALLLMIIPVIALPHMVKIGSDPGEVGSNTSIFNPSPADNFRSVVQGAMTQAAKSCSGVGDVNVVTDDAHVGVTISPNQFAIANDVLPAVRSIIVMYSRILAGFPNYMGYLRVALAERLADGKYHVTALWECQNADVRSVLENINKTGNYSMEDNYLNYVFRNMKAIQYTYRGSPAGQTVWNGASYESPAVGNWLG